MSHVKSLDCLRVLECIKKYGVCKSYLALYPKNTNCLGNKTIQKSIAWYTTHQTRNTLRVRNPGTTQDRYQGFLPFKWEEY